MALGNGLRHVGTHRVLQRDQTEKLEVEIMLITWQRIGRKARLRNTQNAQPCAGHGDNLLGNCGTAQRVHVAQVDNRLRRALGCNHALAPVG